MIKTIKVSILILLFVLLLNIPVLASAKEGSKPIYRCILPCKILPPPKSIVHPKVSKKCFVPSIGWTTCPFRELL
jgi:hypothetical protein